MTALQSSGSERKHSGVYPVEMSELVKWLLEGIVRKCIIWPWILMANLFLCPLFLHFLSLSYSFPSFLQAAFSAPVHWPCFFPVVLGLWSSTETVILHTHPTLIFKNARFCSQVRQGINKHKVVKHTWEDDSIGGDFKQVFYFIVKLVLQRYALCKIEIITPFQYVVV